jgi:hypothetical protein
MNLVSVAIKPAGLNSGNSYGTAASTPPGDYSLQLRRAHWSRMPSAKRKERGRG